MSPPSKKVGGHVHRVPHQIAPMSVGAVRGLIIMINCQSVQVLEWLVL